MLLMGHGLVCFAFSVKCHFDGNELDHGEGAFHSWMTVSWQMHISLHLQITIASLIHLILRSDSCPTVLLVSSLFKKDELYVY